MGRKGERLHGPSKHLELVWRETGQTIKSGMENAGYIDWEDIDLSDWVPEDAMLGFFNLTLNPIVVGSGNLSELDLRPYNSQWAAAMVLILDKNCLATAGKTTVIAPLPIYSQKVSWSMLVGVGWQCMYVITLFGYAKYRY